MRVGRDDVAGPGSRAPDRAAVGLDQHSVVDVGKRRRPGDVGADEVPADDEARAVVEPDAVQQVSRDDVARGRGRAADRDVGARRVVDLDADLFPREGVAARGVRADQIALDQVPAAAETGRAEVDSGRSVAGDQVARGGSRAADGDVGRPVVAEDPEIGIAVGDRAARIGADEVALDDASRRPRKDGFPRNGRD